MPIRYLLAGEQPKAGHYSENSQILRNKYNRHLVKNLYMGFYNCLVILVQTTMNLNAEYSVIFDRVYIHFDDKRLTMVLAAPVKPLGIKFRRENHSEHKDRKIKRVCQGVFLIFVVIPRFLHPFNYPAIISPSPIKFRRWK
jgi:hypothetical protein